MGYFQPMKQQMSGRVIAAALPAIAAGVCAAPDATGALPDGNPNYETPAGIRHDGAARDFVFSDPRG